MLTTTSVGVSCWPTTNFPKPVFKSSHGDHDDFGISATNRLLLWSDCNLIEGQKAYRRCLVLGGIVGPFVGTVRAHSAGSSCARATGSLKGGAETARPRADRDQGLYAHVLLSDIRADQEAVK